MLREKNIAGVDYDAARDRLTVRADEGGPPLPGARLRSVTVLLDASDRLVGVDLGGPELDRIVFLAGAFEDVARTVELTADVALDEAGDPVEVQIPNARKNGLRA